MPDWGVGLHTAGKMIMGSKSTGAQAGCEPSFERKEKKKKSGAVSSNPRTRQRRPVNSSGVPTP